MTMHTLDVKTRDRIAKLLALATRGVGGEQTTATKALDAMLARHGLTRADVTDPDETPVTLHLTVSGREERELAVHVALHYATFTQYVEPASGRKDYVAIAVSRQEASRIALAWEVYRAAYRQERKQMLSALTLAFVHKHALFAKQRDPFQSMTPAAAAPPTPAEAAAQRAQTRRANALMLGMHTVEKPGLCLASGSPMRA